MEVYAYTISLSGQQPLKGLATMYDLIRVLTRMGLLEDQTFEEIIANPTVIDRESGANTYIHAEGEKHEWRLRWIPFF